MNIRSAAIDAARRGWYVAPTQVRSKRPRRGLSWPAVATAEPGRVAAANWQPGENYLIACKKSGLVVLDLDPPKPGYKLPPQWQDEPGIVDGADVLAALCERHGQPWPITYWVQTPRGGSQLYYAAPAGRAIGNRPLGPMIDVRGGGESDGGYVVGIGSMVDERAYDYPVRLVNGGRYVLVHEQEPEVLPAWIADLLDPPRRGQVQSPLCPVQADGQQVIRGTQPRARLHGVIEHVLGGPPGDRNGRLHWAACRVGEMIAVGQLDHGTAEQVLLQAALDAGLAGGEREALATIRSGLRRGAA
jgi:hypothetical protein